MTQTFPPAPGYERLAAVLEAAHEQAAAGKGRQRHASGQPFDKQPILEIGRMVGMGYQTGQAMKKAQEATRMAARGQSEYAVKELLGAINYLAAAVIMIEGEPPIVPLYPPDARAEAATTKF